MVNITALLYFAETMDKILLRYRQARKTAVAEKSHFIHKIICGEKLICGEKVLYL